MKKLLLLAIITALSTPVLAKKDMSAFYTSKNDTGLDLESTDMGIEAKVIEYAFDYTGDIYLGFGVYSYKNNYKGNKIKSNAKYLSWRYVQEQDDGANFTLYAGNDFISSDWKDGSDEISATGIKIHTYLARQFEAGKVMIEPSFEYAKYFHFGVSSLFSTLSAKEMQFGVNFYGEVIPNLQIGAFLGRKQFEEKNITVSNFNEDSDINKWSGVLRPHIKYTFENGAEITAYYELSKYESEGKSNTLEMTIGQDF